MKVLLQTRKWSPRLGKFWGWLEGEMCPAGDSCFNVLGVGGNVLIANMSVSMLEREKAAGRIKEDTESKSEFYSNLFGEKDGHQ